VTPEQFLTFAEPLPEPMLLLTGSGIVLAGNRAVEKRLGLALHQVGGKNLADVVADSTDEIAHYLRSCSRNRSLVLGSLNLLGGDSESVSCRTEGTLLQPRTEGAEAILLLRLIPKKSAVGQFVALNQQIESLRKEICRRRQAEAEARQQAEQLRVTLGSIGDAVIVTDAEGRVRFLNPVAQAMTGWTLEEATGEPLPDVFRIVNEDTRQPVENPALRALREGVVVGLANHTLLVAKDGTERRIDDSAAPIRADEGSLFGAVLVFRDVTEHRRAERQIRESEARNNAVIQTALDCIIMMDHEGHVVEFNPAAEMTFGYRREQVVGKQLADFIIPPSIRERHRHGMFHYLATGEGSILGKRLELPALRADGTEFPVEIAITRIPTDGPPLFTAYLRDVSQHNRNEKHRTVRIAVTHALGEATGLKDGVAGLLRAVCENLGWKLGLFWSVNETGSALACTDGWHGSNETVAEFERDSCARTFKRGEGFPGSVWETGKALWLTDMVQVPQFPRSAAAAKYDLHSVFACPVMVGNRTLGVIEFFTSRIHEPDADLLEMMATVAGQFGQFMERQQAEYALRRSEGRFRGLMEEAPFSVQVFSSNGRTIQVNRAWEELWGITLEQIADYNVLEDPQLEAKGVLDFIRRGFAGETAQVPAVQYDPNETIPNKTRHSDPRRWVSAVVYPLKDAGGRVVEVVLVHNDITARKLAEYALLDAHRQLEDRVAERTAELGRANEFLQALLENVQTGVVACDAAGVLTLVNGVTRSLHGLPEEPIPPDLWAARYRLYQPDGETPMAKEDVPLNRALQGERVHDAEMVIVPLGAPPRTVLTSGQAFFDDHGKKLGAVASMQDITARKQAEVALRQANDELERRVEERTEELGRANAALKDSEGKLRLLADTIPQLTWMARPDGHIFWYNRRWYEYTGTTPDQMEGWGWQSVHDQDELPKVLERWKASIDSGEPFDMVFPLKGADGQFRMFLTRISPFTNEGGQILYWFGTNTDIDETMRMESDLLKAAEELRRSNLDLEQFAYVASHDLQEPLRAVSGCAQVLNKRYHGKLDGRADELVTHIVDGVSRMQNLINDLLSYSRLGTQGNAFELCDCNAVLDQALANLEATVKESGAVVTYDQLPPLSADAGQLTQLFQNFISNAIKFRGTAPPRIHVGAVRLDGEWLVSVKDGGIGIEREYFERIFVIFQRLHTRSEYPGTGIGLAICKKIVERHGGCISVESEPGLGSTFSFTIPDRK